MYFSLLEKPNGFQYYLINILYFFIIIIVSTVVKIFTSDRKRKKDITFKNPLTKKINKFWNSTNKFFQLNYCCKQRYVKKSGVLPA